MRSDLIQRPRIEIVWHSNHEKWEEFAEELHTNLSVDPKQPLENRITEHDVYGRLGRSRSQRAYRYRTLFSTALDQQAIHAIRTAASFSRPLGNSRFKAQIEAALGRQIGQAKRGRPQRCLQD